MFDQSYGLRFDIYERINLAEDLPGIEELEEAELIPHIQVISQQDQATLRGHLLLAGVYKGDTETGESEPLEHWIPVEITVPMNRVSSLDDIAVEIENFDIDLLSRRSLNITGVLSLRGIQAAAPGVRDQAWANEEFTVVHAPEASGTQPSGEPAAEEGRYEPFQASDSEELTGSNDDAASQAGEAAPYVNFRASIQEQEERTQQYLASWAQYENQVRREEVSAPETRSPAADDADARDTVEYALHNDPEPAAQEAEPSVPSVWQFERKVEPEPAAETQAEEAGSVFPGVVDRKGDDVEAVPDLQAVETFAQETYEAPEPAHSAAEEPEVALKAEESSEPGKPELKVAFSTKGSDASASSGVGFSSLLHSSRLVQDQDIAALDEEEKDEALPEPASSEDVEWKSLFLGNRREETPFRKVRMCIVQREETLDIIAERYQLSPRELLLYNRMSEQNVEEGQVLYIPQ